LASPSSYDGLVPTEQPIPYGPQAYRKSVRRLGPLAALVPAIVLLAVMAAARALIACPASGACTGRAATAWVLPAMALPTAVVAGLPVETGTSRLAIVVGTSALLWLAVGRVAAKRATQRPIATWRDFVREFAWLAGAVWIGVLVGVALIGVGVGHLGNIL
jgi:hypothetical protein